VCAVSVCVVTISDRVVERAPITASDTDRLRYVTNYNLQNDHKASAARVLKSPRDYRVTSNLHGCQLQVPSRPDTVCIRISAHAQYRFKPLPVTGPRTWNNLPASVRSAPSLLSFERELATCLFSRRYT